MTNNELDLFICNMYDSARAAGNPRNRALTMIQRELSACHDIDLTFKMIEVAIGRGERAKARKRAETPTKAKGPTKAQLIFGIAAALELDEAKLQGLAGAKLEALENLFKALKEQKL
jgi:hypothetical protein